MAKIKADFSSIITMVGPVKFYQRPCPYGKKGISGKVAMVGSSDCQMCPDFDSKHQHIIKGTELVGENVNCKHE